MGKLDELMRASRSVAAESMGVARPAAAPMHGASPPAAAVPEKLRGVVRSKAAAEIPVDRIGPDPDQPREEFDEAALDHLAESLRARGQLQPIRVRWDEGRGSYVVVAGERRWRAAARAGLPTMSCIIMEAPATPAELLAIQLVENLLREDLKPIEQAKAFRTLMDANGWSTHQLARELAIAQPNVVRALALLELPEAVQAHVERGELSPATAYEVSKLDDPGRQAEVAARAVSEGLSRAETIEAVREAAGRSAKGRAGQGRGASAKAKAARPRVFRTSVGKVTVEPKRAIDDAEALAALEEAAAQLRVRCQGDGQAAA